VFRFTLKSRYAAKPETDIATYAKGTEYDIMSMKTIIKTVLPILLATIWISVSEFVRNTFLLHNYWTEHFLKMGQTFPEKPINGAVWGIWSLFFAIAIFIFSKKYTLIQTTFLSWFVGFVFMWLVIGNLGVLPFGILVYAIPLSLLEAFLASYIIFKLKNARK